MGGGFEDQSRTGDQAGAQVYRWHHDFLVTCGSRAANFGVLDTTMIGRGGCEVEPIRIQSFCIDSCCESRPPLAAHRSNQEKPFRLDPNGAQLSLFVRLLRSCYGSPVGACGQVAAYSASRLVSARPCLQSTNYCQSLSIRNQDSAPVRATAFLLGRSPQRCDEGNGSANGGLQNVEALALRK